MSCVDELCACVLVLLAAAMVTLLSGGIERFTNVSPQTLHERELLVGPDRFDRGWCGISASDGICEATPAKQKRANKMGRCLGCTLMLD